MNSSTLTPRQKGVLGISGAVAALSGALLIGRAVKPAVQTADAGAASLDAAVTIKATCLPTDLPFGARIVWDPTASLYVSSDGHECQKLSAAIVLDKTPDGGLFVSDHAATQVCNHLGQIGCRQGAGCLLAAHNASAQMQACILAAQTFTAAAVCSPQIVCR